MSNRPTQAQTADPYVVLGVARDASRREMAEAYRRLAKRYHPDVDSHPAAVERMRRINAAWRTLSDRRRPAKHDAKTTSSGHWRSAHRTPRRAWTRPATAWAEWGPVYHEPSSARPTGQSTITRRSRSARPHPVDVRFQDTVWAALLAAGVMFVVLFAAAYAGSMSSSTPMA